MSALLKVNQHPMERVARVIWGVGLVAMSAMGTIGALGVHWRGATPDRTCRFGCARRYPRADGIVSMGVNELRNEAPEVHGNRIGGGSTIKWVDA